MHSSNEITETAKAAQEVAKTSKAAIEATEKLGGFLAGVTKEPLEAITGLMADKLRFMRWERQLRLYQRQIDILRERGISSPRTVPPKLALPIVMNASLEEDDELQDLWAQLLASALDPNFRGEIRSAFIDILKQLAVTDVHVLNAIYSEMLRRDVGDDYQGYLAKTLVGPKRIVSILNINLELYESSIDNLLRLRLVSSNVGFERYSSAESYAGGRGDVLNHRDYDLVCLTPFGISFLEACHGSEASFSSNPL